MNTEFNSSERTAATSRKATEAAMEERFQKLLKFCQSEIDRAARSGEFSVTISDYSIIWNNKERYLPFGILSVEWFRLMIDDIAKHFKELEYTVVVKKPVYLAFLRNRSITISWYVD